MPRLLMLLMLALLLRAAAVAQENEPKPVVSKDPLTAEQIAVYRAFLEVYAKGSDGALNLANVTGLLGGGEPFWDADCVKSLHLGPGPMPAIVHRLDPAVALSDKMVLVDPEAQAKTVKQNDPQNALEKSVRSGEQQTDQQMDETLKQAFHTGLFTFSEIAFDKRHRHAVLQYSFWCGRLCAHGGMVILKRAGEKWKIARECATWIS